MTNEEVNSRLESPDNLINRLRSSMTTRCLPMRNEDDKSEPTPTVAELVDNLEDKLKFGAVRAKALSVLHDSLEVLHGNLGNVTKIKDLSGIASDMNRILTADESSKNSKTGNNIIIYKPVVNRVEHYETVVVNE